MNTNLKVKVIVGLCIGLVLILVTQNNSYRKIVQLIHSQAVISGIYEVNSNVQNLRSNIAVLESESRGFAITGKSNFLSSGEMAGKEVKFNLNALIVHSKSDEILKNALTKLVPFVNAKVEFLNGLILKRNIEGKARALDLIEQGRGKYLMEEIELALNEILNYQSKLLYAENKKNKAVIAQVNASSFLCAGIAIIMALFFAWLIFRDLDVKSRLQAELVANEARIKSFLDALPFGVYILGANNVVFYANQKSGEILGKGVIPNTDREKMAEVYQIYEAGTDNLYPTNKMPVVRALNGETGFIAEDIEVLNNGKRTPLSVSGSYIKDEKGQIAFGIASFEDITDKKRAEEALQKKSKQLIEAQKLAHIGSWEWTKATGIITRSQELYNIYGYSEEDFKKFAGALNYIHPEDRELVDSILTTAHKNKTEFDFYYRCLRPDNTIRYLHARGTAITDTKGALVGMHGTAQDVTEEKRIESELIIAKNRAEEFALAKEQFLANMSHEIRTPLNAIIGFSNLINKKKLDDDDAESLNAIQSSGNNLLNIVNDILDVSKIQAGMMKIEKTTFSIRSLMKSVSVLLIQKARDKNLQLNFICQENVPEYVSGDSTRLTQIIINLVGNAIKFSEYGTIEIGCQVLAERHEGFVIEFYVRDNGIGIAQNKLDSIFDRFNQASTDTTRLYGGTGLGLSIVKSLVGLQGGEINVKSKIGEGSLFTFSIPYNHVALSEQLAINNSMHFEKETDLGPLHVLLVEDNELNQKLAVKVLTNFGFTIDLAVNGYKAVQKVQNGSYDIVLMDLQMPEVDGIEATRIIRKEMHNDVPIIAMTAHAMAGEKERCLSLGMSDYITKPFRPKDLYSKISNLLLKDASLRNKEVNKEKQSFDPKVIDLTYLHELAEGNKKFCIEIFDLFLKNIPLELDLLEKAITLGEFTEIIAISHKMQSSANIMGVTFLANLLSQIEQKSQLKEKLVEVATIFKTIKPLVLQILLEVRAERAGYIELS